VQAAEIGNTGEVPLGIASAELQFRERLYQGQQGTVTSGGWRGREVAIKKACIGTSADMERFRTEIRLLVLAGKHENVVPLLAARVLPPGTSWRLRLCKCARIGVAPHCNTQQTRSFDARASLEARVALVQSGAPSWYCKELQD